MQTCKWTKVGCCGGQEKARRALGLQLPAGSKLVADEGMSLDIPRESPLDESCLGIEERIFVHTLLVLFCTLSVNHFALSWTLVLPGLAECVSVSPS